MEKKHKTIDLSIYNATSGILQVKHKCELILKYHYTTRFHFSEGIPTKVKEMDECFS